MHLDACTHEDYLQILKGFEDFWPTDRARRVHHPMFVHEFGNTAWVVREDGRVVAYLLGFWSQTEPVGYIHLVGVRRSRQRRGTGRWLYEQFESQARAHGCSRLKALTVPENTDSIAFHRALGFTMLGEAGDDGIPIVRDYFAPGEHRVVFEKVLD